MKILDILGKENNGIIFIAAIPKLNDEYYENAIFLNANDIQIELDYDIPIAVRDSVRQYLINETIKIKHELLSNSLDLPNIDSFFNIQDIDEAESLDLS